MKTLCYKSLSLILLLSKIHLSNKRFDCLGKITSNIHYFS